MAETHGRGQWPTHKLVTLSPATAASRLVPTRGVAVRAFPGLWLGTQGKDQRGSAHHAHPGLARGPGRPPPASRPATRGEFQWAAPALRVRRGAEAQAGGRERSDPATDLPAPLARAGGALRRRPRGRGASRPRGRGAARRPALVGAGIGRGARCQDGAPTT